MSEMRLYKQILVAVLVSYYVLMAFILGVSIGAVAAANRDWVGPEDFVKVVDELVPAVTSQPVLRGRARA